MIFKDGKKLKKKEFKKERELQEFVQNNLKEILGYTYLQEEFIINNYRFDTLAFDEENNAFIIIEYKKKENEGLVDQGYSYLATALDRKADLVLKYNQVKSVNKEIDDFDWSQTRIVFISPMFNKNQLNSTSFSDMPFDLYKATKYEDGLIEIEKVENKNSKIKAEAIIKTDDAERVSKEIVVYTEEDFTDKLSDTAKELYEEFRDRVLALGDIDIDVKKFYIAFKGKTNIVDVVKKTSKDQIEININMKKGTLNDPSHITKDVSNVGHWANGDYRVIIKTEDDIENVIPLIKQSLAVNRR